MTSRETLDRRVTLLEVRMAKIEAAIRLALQEEADAARLR